MMKLIKNLTLIIVLITASVAVSKAYDFTIVKADGTPNAKIYVASSNLTVEKYAAEELQRCIAIMTGVELTITYTQPSSGLFIVIGEPGTNSLIAGNTALQLGVGVDEQKIAVRRVDNHHILYLAGKTAPAALWATYTFLQDYLGVRWLWPGNTGEFIPKRMNTDVKIVGTLSILQQPRIETRSLAIVKATFASDAIHSDVDTWMARNRMNSTGKGKTSQITADRKKKGFKLRIGGHNIRMDSTTLANNVGWAALRSSNPDSRPASDDAQLCWGNAGVRAAIIDSIKKWQDDNPAVDVIHFYPADNQNYCIPGCVPCTNLPGTNDISTRWQEFSKLVIAGINRPNKKYWTYAYQGYKPAPATNAAPFEFIGYTLYEVCYRHPFMQTPHSEGNDESNTDITSWGQRLQTGGGKMGIRGYEFIPFADPMYVPLVKWETEQMDWIVANGLTGYLSELRPYGFPASAAPEKTDWNVNRINLYAAARAMWSDITPDSIINDWHRTVYGEAQVPMKDYYNTIASFWENAGAGLHIQEYGKSAANEVNNFLDLQKIGQLNNYFNLARDKVEELVTDTALASFINKQIDLESKMLREWQLIHTYANERADRYRTQVGKLSIYPGINSSAWDTIAPLQPFIKWDGDTAVAQTSVKMVWTSTDLALQIVNQDDSVANRMKNATAHDDDQILSDECIEILIQPDPNKNEYFKLAVNSTTTSPFKYSAVTKGGLNFDKTWAASPAMTAQTSANTTNDTWTANIKIPFAALGITAADGKQFKIMIKRGRAEQGTSDSGWPDASFYRQNHFGTATLVNKVTKPLENRIILYDENHSGAVAVSVEFQKREWITTSRMSGETELEPELEEDAAVLLIRYKENAGVSILSPDFYQNKVLPYLKKGRLVIITNAPNNISSLFANVPNLTLRTDEISSHQTSSLLPGAWLSTPNDLDPVVFGVKPAPYSAYTPSGAWTGRAMRWMGTSGVDSVQVPYLLSYRSTPVINKGMLVVTTSAMGYGGGYEIFGSLRLNNVVKLVENLRAEQDALYPYEQQMSLASTNPVLQSNIIETPEAKPIVFRVTGAENTIVYASFSAAEAGNGRILIRDLNGYQLAEKKILLQKGDNQITIPVHIADDTTYVADLRVNGKDFRVKFSKR